MCATTGVTTNGKLVPCPREQSDCLVSILLFIAFAPACSDGNSIDQPASASQLSPAHSVADANWHVAGGVISPSPPFRFLLLQRR